MTLEFKSTTFASNGSDLHLIGDRDGKVVRFAIDLSIAREALRLHTPFQAAPALDSWRASLEAACWVSYLRHDTGMAAPQLRVGREDFSPFPHLRGKTQSPSHGASPESFQQSLGPMYARVSAQMDR